MRQSKVSNGQTIILDLFSTYEIHATVMNVSRNRITVFEQRSLNGLAVVVYSQGE